MDSKKQFLPEVLKTIVLADDDLTILTILEKCLPGFGFQVVGTAQNGLQALELVRDKKPQLILLDFHMPLMNGMDALQKIAAFKTTAVVILTGDHDPAVAGQAMNLGASAYLKKPFEVDSLLACIHSAWFQFQHLRSWQDQANSLSEALETRKVVEKAKGILMEQQGLLEEAAHQVLQKMSQEQGISLKEVCRSVIQVKMVLGKPNQKKSRKS